MLGFTPGTSDAGLDPFFAWILLVEGSSGPGPDSCFSFVNESSRGRLERSLLLSASSGTELHDVVVVVDDVTSFSALDVVEIKNKVIIVVVVVVVVGAGRS